METPDDPRSTLKLSEHLASFELFQSTSKCETMFVCAATVKNQIVNYQRNIEIWHKLSFLLCSFIM